MFWVQDQLIINLVPSASLLDCLSIIDRVHVQPRSQGLDPLPGKEVGSCPNSQVCV